jgi:hypothetical protein
MKDIRIKVRAYNNRLLTLRERAGFDNGAAASKAIGVGYQSYLDLEKMTASPINKKTGGWRKIVVDIATYFNRLPEDIFPEFLHKITARPIELELDAKDIPALEGAGIQKALPTPEDIVERQDLQKSVAAALETLTGREKTAIEMMMGFNDKEEASSKEIAAALGVSACRARFITRTAFDKLRDQCRYGALHGFGREQNEYWRQLCENRRNYGENHMTKEELQTEIARVNKLLEDGGDSDQWKGYIRGLQRGYYGSRMVNDHEHTRIVEESVSAVPEKNYYARGYLEGSRAVGPQWQKEEDARRLVKEEQRKREKEWKRLQKIETERAVAEFTKKLAIQLPRATALHAQLCTFSKWWCEADIAVDDLTEFLNLYEHDYPPWGYPNYKALGFLDNQGYISKAFIDFCHGLALADDGVPAEVIKARVTAWNTEVKRGEKILTLLSAFNPTFQIKPTEGMCQEIYETLQHVAEHQSLDTGLTVMEYLVHIGLLSFKDPRLTGDNWNCQINPRFLDFLRARGESLAPIMVQEVAVG